MTDIYAQHRAAFAQVSAYVVLETSGERVATIAIKHPRDGAGRLTAYVHWIGVPMVRGSASGGGYDKTSSAIGAAAEWMTDMPSVEAGVERWRTFRNALHGAEHSWQSKLTDAGFTVLQAV